MYKIFEKDDGLLNFAIEIENFVFKLLLSKEKNKYSDKIIKELDYILKEKKIEKIIEFILEQNIDITKLTKFNYLNLKTIFNKNKKIYKLFSEYKYLYDFINNLIVTDKLDLITKHIKNTKMNSSRQKGQLFFEIINNYKEYFHIPIINKIEDLDFNNNFIFLSNNDKKHNEFLRLFFNINLDKNKDMIIKFKNNIYIIEAKSINETGGVQNLQFKDLENNTRIDLEIKKNNTNFKISGLGIIYGKSLFYNNKYSIAASKNDKILSLAEFIYNFSCYFFK